jgi:hypothetical protein
MEVQAPGGSYCMIHDSYGTHAADTERLRDTLRREFAAIYRTDWLAEVEAFIRSQLPRRRHSLPTRTSLPSATSTSPRSWTSEFFFS